MNTAADQPLEDFSVDDIQNPGQVPAASAVPQESAKPDANADLRAAIGELTQTIKTGQQAPSAEPQLTEEQKRQLWGVWNPTEKDPEYFAKFLRLPADMDPAEKKAVVEQFQSVFGDMQTGLVRQALVGAQNLLRAEMQKLREEYAPLQEHVTTVRAEKMRTDFYESFPALSDKRFTNLVKAQATLLAGQEFKDQNEYFKALAEGVAETIRQVIPDFDLGKKVETKPTATPSRLPRTSVGGTGGTGAQAPAAAASGDDAGSLQW